MKKAIAKGFFNYPLMLKDVFLDPVRESDEFQAFWLRLKSNMSRLKRNLPIRSSIYNLSSIKLLISASMIGKTILRYQIEEAPFDCAQAGGEGGMVMTVSDY